MSRAEMLRNAEMLRKVHRAEMLGAEMLLEAEMLRRRGEMFDHGRAEMSIFGGSEMLISDLLGGRAGLRHGRGQSGETPEDPQLLRLPAMRAIRELNW